MAKYFSAERCAFFDTDIFDATSLPQDAVLVSDADYVELMAKQDQGFKIVPGAGGAPEAISQTCGTCSNVEHEEKIASSTELGHVKLGDGVHIDEDGAIYGFLSYLAQTLTNEQKAQIKSNLSGLFLELTGGNLTGNLTVQSKNVVRSVNNTQADANGNVNISDLDSEGTNWKRFKSGLQICMGDVTFNGGDKVTVTLPKEFAGRTWMAYQVLFTDKNATDVGSTSNAPAWYAVSSTAFNVYHENYNGAWTYVAIGFWK